MEIKATVIEAARATSAATTIFDPIQIGHCKFADGALGANNPVEEVEGEAFDIWGNGAPDLKPLVKCFVSIGTGNQGTRPIEKNIFKFLAKSLPSMVTDTEGPERRFMANWRQHCGEKRYFRFNVDQGLQDVHLAEYKRQDRLQAATRTYLGHQVVKSQAQDCVENLRWKQGMCV